MVLSRSSAVSARRSSKRCPANERCFLRLREVDDLGGRSLESIHIGGVFASDKPAVVRTLLGSCISVCLRDAVTHVGGMNHFMLPNYVGGSMAASSYGVHAMELLINKCMQLGADRRRLEAKVFGGGHVLRLKGEHHSVPKQNIEFARSFLKTEAIPVITHNVGGFCAREVFFFTDSGRVLLRRLAPTGVAEELAAPSVSQPTRETQNDDDNITLF